ncbi:MAG: serine/threonine protein kinase [Kofleriaceae bacterium]|nr:serine/threonine protein kinase [Kofleriaceae bacterium]
MFVCAECGASQPMDGRCAVDGTPLSPVAEDVLLGTTIGAYRIARLLGVGGMGRVYKGVHPTIGSRVAIKVLSRECSDRRDLVDRFFSEAKAVNLIRHESIVNVLDLSTLPDGRPYIVMEYLDGSPLASIVENAQRAQMPLPLGGIAKLAAEVLDAVGSAHAKGIIHRDLKPDNIFVTPSGRAKVLDFGIAKLQPELGGSATHTGSLLGTPHYMSPEQASGRPVDPRADIYAIGVILFECATLSRPFIGSSLFDLLRMHVETPPPSPRAMRPDMPPALEQVIYTALAKHPEQRFASAQAMSMALQQATMHLPPEQWAPLVPASSSRVSAGGWAPTMPASWAGSSQRSSVAQNPTPMTGQVGTGAGRAPQAGSRKGLWLALTALLVVGGGVTAAVIASKSDAKEGEGSGSNVVAAGSSAAAGGDDSKLTTAAGSAAVPSAGSGDPWGERAGSDDTADTDDADDPDDSDTTDVPTTRDTPTKTDKTAKTDKPTKTDKTTKIDKTSSVDDDVPDDIASLPPEAQDALAKADKQMDEMYARMPPTTFNMLPDVLKAALKKYGKWSKVPMSVRQKIAKQMSSGTTSATSQEIADALHEDKPKTPGLGPDGWLVYRHFKAPGGFDPKHVDVAKYLPIALAEAKRLVPDAVLFRIDAHGIYPDGHGDFTAVDNGGIDYRFISPSRAKRDPKLPIGAKQEWKCQFRIMIDKGGPWSAPIDGWDCKDKLVGVPKCSFAQVWKKALAKKAPANAIANFGYWANSSSGAAQWYFTIPDDDVKFTEVFKDDC